MQAAPKGRMGPLEIFWPAKSLSSSPATTGVTQKFLNLESTRMELGAVSDVAQSLRIFSILGSSRRSHERRAFLWASRLRKFLHSRRRSRVLSSLDREAANKRSAPVAPRFGSTSAMREQAPIEIDVAPAVAARPAYHCSRIGRACSAVHSGKITSQRGTQPALRPFENY